MARGIAHAAGGRATNPTSNVFGTVSTRPSPTPRGALSRQATTHRCGSGTLRALSTILFGDYPGLRLLSGIVVAGTVAYIAGAVVGSKGRSSAATRSDRFQGSFVR